MIDAFLKTLSNLKAEDAERVVRDVVDGLSSIDLSDKAKSALALVGATGVTAETVRSAGARAAKRTGDYVMENPRTTGAGVGAALAVGLGAYLLIRSLKTQEELDGAAAGLLPAPELEEA